MYFYAVWAQFPDCIEQEKKSFLLFVFSSQKTVTSTADADAGTKNWIQGEWKIY